MINDSDEFARLVDVAGRLVLGLVALFRAERKEIPTVVRELSGWWHHGS
jgi:hypothetical protein